ncbi:hypothetical protein B5S28_g1146 [[Candida] boidinii]|nr:hypothetical protein B5S28_g1146 [[Candida] boidinii]
MSGKDQLAGDNPLKRSSSSTSSTIERNNIVEKNSNKRNSILLELDYDEDESDPSSEVSSDAAPIKEPRFINGNLHHRPKKSTDSKESESTPTNIQESNDEDKKKKKAYSTKKPKDWFRYKKDGSFRSKFGDYVFSPQESIIEHEIRFGKPFYGFFVCFWFCIAVLGTNVLLHYWLDGGLMFESDIFKLLSTKLIQVGLTDLCLYLLTYFSVFIQFLIKWNIISWDKTGLILQSIFQILFVIFAVFIADYFEFPWIAQIFLVLHSLVMLMKMHSYAFYNGYLWNIEKELKFSKLYLKKHKSDDQIDDSIISKLNKSVEFCTFELKAQSTSDPFPTNINLLNYFNYSMFPTLIYVIDFPRTEKIRIKFLLSKICGIFGVIYLMIIISQSHLYPIVIKCIELRETTSLWYRIKLFPIILLDTIPPFLTVYLLVFYLIWELILNAIAELSRFADRDFYRYWWNSTTWDEYARDWNTPVHRFLLRHVYHSSISALNVSKTVAMFITFFLSSVVHELAMFVIFKKFRGYLLCLQMSQLPLVAISNTKIMKDQKTIGNAIFWFGIILGPSLMCTVYLLF